MIEAEHLWAWPEDERGAYAEYERRLQEIPNAERLRQWHDMTAGHVHIAGTEGDWKTIEQLEEWWSEVRESESLDRRRAMLAEAVWDELFEALRAADPYGRQASIHNGPLLYNHRLG